MEKLLMDTLNAGIALFKSGEDRLKSSIDNLTKVYEEIKSKGEADNSDQARQLRDLLQKTLGDLEGIANKANYNYQETLDRMKVDYEKITEQIEAMLPSQVKETAQSTLEELKKLLSQKGSSGK